MDENSIKLAVSDVMSDFYNEVMKKRFDQIEERFDQVDAELMDLRLTNQTLTKIVDYSRLEARVIDLEDRLKKLEATK